MTLPTAETGRRHEPVTGIDAFLGVFNVNARIPLSGRDEHALRFTADLLEDTEGCEDLAETMRALADGAHLDIAECTEVRDFFLTRIGRDELTEETLMAAVASLEDSTPTR